MCVCFSPFAIKSALDFFEGMRGASERIGFASCYINQREENAKNSNHIVLTTQGVSKVERKCFKISI